MRLLADRRARMGLGKPETFKFLGFTFMCGKSRQGKFLVHRKSRRDRMQAKLAEVKTELRKRMHQPIPEQGRWLGQIVRGYFAYHAFPRTARRSPHSIDTWYGSGTAHCGAAARKIDSRGSGCSGWLATGSLNPATSTPGRTCVLRSNTRGKNRMPESGLCGGR
jgi:hypothetical protein